MIRSFPPKPPPTHFFLLEEENKKKCEKEGPAKERTTRIVSPSLPHLLPSKMFVQVVLAEK